MTRSTSLALTFVVAFLLACVAIEHHADHQHRPTCESYRPCE
jgi:hypothetical protein